MIRDIVAALMVLTRFPVPWKILSDQPPDITKSLWAYPLVGFLVSAIGGAVYLAATLLLLPPWVAVLLALMFLILTTGALHEDGLADMADGFGGGRDPEHKLDIMRDSRIGTYGSLALLISMGLRLSALAAVTSGGVIVALLVSGTLSRMMIVISLRLFPPARKDGLAAQTGKPTAGRLGLAVLISALVTFALLPWATGLIVITLALLATLFIGWLSLKQVGGITGDILGAVQQTSEIIILLGLLSCGRMLT